MYHSVNFGDKNTYDDWKLVPDSRPVVVPPEPKFIFDEIPGASGSLDLSSTLTGFVSYQDRTGSFDFIVLNDYGEWHERYSEIMGYLHGKRMRMSLEDDPNYFYIGRFSVSSWDSGENWSTISIDYHLDPFKYSASENVLSILLSGTGTTAQITNIKELTFPTIRSAKDLTLTVNGGRQYSLVANKDYDTIPFYPDGNGRVNLVMSYTSSSVAPSLSIKYREVKL